ncbi:MAG: type II secretion system F family protein [Dehalococcoidia bacterium]
MDILVVAAAGSLFVTIMAFALAFSSNTANAQIRGRLEGVLSGASVIDTVQSSAALRKSQSPVTFLKLIFSGEWLHKIERELALAESKLQPLDFISIRVAIAALGFAGPFIFLSGAIGNLPAGVVSLGTGGVGFMLPQYWLHWRQEGRRKKLEAQLPEALVFVANSLKAGFGLLQSLSMAAEQLEHPVATEFELTVHETNMGSSMDEAFLSLSERSDSYDLDLVVTAMLIQRASGGNLSEILETVASTMRERARIRQEIQTLTAQQKLTGIVIALLPVGVGGMFFLVSPEYISTLFTDTMGQVLLGGAIVLETIGILVIQRILAIEV